jgi:WhiB family redox-sensing transcriptional regulator
MSSKPKKNPSNWYEHAACLGYETDLWFPDAPQGRDYFALARQVCKTCEVKQECLDFALSFTSENDRFGMFGGLSPKQRMIIRNKQNMYEPLPKPVEMPVRRTVYKQPHVYTYAFHAKDVIHPQAFEIKKRRIDLISTDIPQKTAKLMKMTPSIVASTLTAQSSAAMLLAGWEDPLDARTCAAMFMGASHVIELARQGFESEVITAQEYAAVQGVAQLAMQVWKFHAEQPKPEVA